MKPVNKLRAREAGVDWQAMHRQLEHARRALDESAALPRDRQEEILRERARKLAQAGGDGPDAAAADGIDVLVFQVAGECYAFETTHIERVYPLLPITAIPGVPDFVVGIIAAEGGLLSVIDLRSLLDLPLLRLAEPKAIVVLRGASMEFGVLAEEIIGVERHALGTLERELPTLSNIDASYMIGITPGRTAILDAHQMLNDARLVVDAG